MSYKDPVKARAHAVIRQTRYLAKNPDKRKRKKCQWYVRHKEERVAKAIINAKEWRAKNPKKIKDIHVKWYIAKRRARDAAAPRPKPERCEIFNCTGKIVYDHDHVSGKFRTWACDKCNTIMGFAKDNPAHLRAIADHLERFQESLQNG